MLLKDWRELELPTTSGVYFFLGKNKKILYIGKATNLKTRVRSYFDKDIVTKRSPLISQMVAEAISVEVSETDSVLEALLLETNLIKTHKPRYNTISKDDKSYNHLIITKEEWPRVLVVRGKDMANFADNEIRSEFGPFPSGLLFREALKIVKKLFQFYDTNKPLAQLKTKMEKGKFNFNQQIGLYPKQMDKKEYLKNIKYLELFFRGEKKKLLIQLEKDMKALAKKQLFEEANQIKRKIFALNHIQDIALLKHDINEHSNKRIEAYDVAHLAGGDMVGVMTVIENGAKKSSEYRQFNIKTVKRNDDTKALKEMLTRRLKHHEWPLPQLIVVDGSTAQKNAALSVLTAAKLTIPIAAVVKDEHHKPIRIIANAINLKEFTKEILLANAEAHRFSIMLHRRKRNKNWLNS